MKNKITIHIFTAILSFIGALLMIGFSTILLSDMINLSHKSTYLLLGILYYILSIVMLREKSRELFITYFATIFQISSVILLLISSDLNILFFHVNIYYHVIVTLSLISITQAIFYLLVDSKPHKILASFFTFFALDGLMVTLGLGQLVGVLFVAVLLFSIKKHIEIAYGVTIAILLSLFFSLNHDFYFLRRGFRFEYNFTYIAVVLMSVLVGYFIANLLKEKNLLANNRYTIISFIVTVFGVVLFYFQPTIAITMFLILFWFYHKSLALMIASFLMFLFFIYKFYYMLDSTLLEKSLIMMTSGILLFGFRYFLKKGFKNA